MSRDDNIKTTFERVRSEYGCVVKSNEVKEKKKKHFDHLVLFHSLVTFLQAVPWWSHFQPYFCPGEGDGARAG